VDLVEIAASRGTEANAGSLEARVLKALPAQLVLRDYGARRVTQGRRVTVAPRATRDHRESVARLVCPVLRE
jgi:hypothetical protein